MTSPLTGRVKPAQPRRLHFIMRDATMIEGQIHIGEDQSLVSYLNSRRGGWMNLTRARRPKLDEHQGHMIMQADQIVIASAPDQNMQIAASQAAGLVERPVEIVLLGGKTLRAHLLAAPQQRLSDVVAASGKFMGVMKATLTSDGRAAGDIMLGDIALNIGAIEFVREHRAADESANEGTGGGAEN
jgi:hypothetical protein